MPGSDDSTDSLTRLYQAAHGSLCARTTVSPAQCARYLLCAFLLTLLFLYRWDLFIVVVSSALMMIYGVAAFLRLVSAALSLRHAAEERVSPAEYDAVPDSGLPVYTVLVPLYHEEAVAAKILKRLARLDYPKEKLDVRLLLECDDSETRAALDAAAPLPAWVTVQNIPDGRPRTKPRACNYGLRDAKGEYLVIFDAEDDPEPDQLKKALAVFRRDPDGLLLCVQAKLNFYNAKQNLLTRLFTIEYSTNFDLQLPGLRSFSLPLPLGGTSNHFRTAPLAGLGGWDPFNVTEDCDLGIRIYEQGYRTTVLDSTTWEEANPKLGNWLRQRSRWVKGFLQTHLVHYRHPFQTLKRLGFAGFFGCYSFVGASVLMMLMNLMYWPLILLYAVLLAHGWWHGETLSDMIVGPHTGASLYHGIEIGPWHLAAWPLFYLGPGEDPFLSRFSQVFFCVGTVLFSVNFLLVGVHAAACVKRRFYSLVPLALLMPLYWVLISLAAWKGVLQFVTKPFYWEKTRHGLTAPTPEPLTGGMNHV